ncbi:AraC family transcriptional regulator [Serratia sp. M24T3]|uniref:AraC family transcriptional regulator n=1 Tax=Serratia sp. M24T3 TaxID=932213 RepID=UPI00025B8DF8|nr:AraC family transcriptional regulator [Serratia sp. M24T3]EIC86374.1 AraC family transcriptional regulator [Serratia sp. M24T3]
MKETARFYFEKNLHLLQRMLAKYLTEPGDIITPVEGLKLHRFNHTDMAKPHFYNPLLIIAVQGKKWVRIGTQDYAFGEHNCFISGVNMPVSSCLLEATENEPYLSMSLELDSRLIATLAQSVPAPVNQSTATATAVGAMVQPISPDLLEAFLRMMELIDKPEDAKILGPLIYQEIHFRLMATPFGNQLRLFNTAGSKSNLIRQSINWLVVHYKESLSMEDLAAKINMAPSTFHKHFKEVTALSPLQYQKHLRLSEAQRLMLANNYTASQAAFEVGYESTNQFSREYKRLFGESPKKNITGMTTG